MIKVLITSAGCGNSVSVIKCLNKQNELPIHITAIDMDESSAGLHLANEHLIAPSIEDESCDYIDFLISTCREREIDVLFCSADHDNAIVSENKEEVELSGVTALCNEEDVTLRCSNKIKAIQHCVNNDIRIPKTNSGLIRESGRVIHESIDWLPLIIKPAVGRGGKLNKIIRSEEEKRRVVLEKEFFYQEFIDGKEYSIDTLSDRDGKCLAVLPRERVLVKAGESVKTKIVKDEKLIEYGKNLAELFELQGVGCLQCIEKDGKLYFIEINPRYGTGVTTGLGAGINMPLLNIKLFLGMEVKEEELDYKDGVIMSRYWEDIYI